MSAAVQNPFVIQRLADPRMANAHSLSFFLPPELEASEPPEARGLRRDQVRLMVSYRSDNRVAHTTFDQLGNYLGSGDVLVINTSATRNAAIEARRADGTALELHISTHLPADLWIVEVRVPGEQGSRPFRHARSGEVLALPGDASATLLTPYDSGSRAGQDAPTRLWIATLRLACPIDQYLPMYGLPIRYGYVKQAWPSTYYQTVFASEMGSAEMPSAGRAFTAEMLTRLIGQGVQILPLVLHTGVASLEDHEPPYEEWYRVPLETARTINMARGAGKRIVAVGTTVVRALETVTDADGGVHPGQGWTSEIITPERGVRAVNGLLTGFHEPRATHMAMLEALAGIEHLEITYAAALHERYLWHEFGDLHLILP